MNPKKELLWGLWVNPTSLAFERRCSVLAFSFEPPPAEAPAHLGALYFLTFQGFEGFGSFVV